MALYDIDGNVIKFEADVSKASVLSKTRTIENPNLVDPSKMVVGRLDSNGNINTAQATCRTSDYIPCSAGMLVCAGNLWKGNHNPFYNCIQFWEVSSARAFYDSNKHLISAVVDYWKSDYNVMRGIEVPTGAAFVRISFGGGYGSSNPTGCFCYVESEPFTNPSPYFENNIEIVTPDDSQTWDKWGQKWLLFGDSLTNPYGGMSWDMSTAPVGGIGWKDYADPLTDRVPWTGYFWASDIARRHGYILDNRANSGSNIYESRVYHDVSGVFILDAFIAELLAGTVEEPDLITIGFGANTIEDEIGTNADTSETRTTAYGGTKYFIETLNKYCPHARKVYILYPVQNVSNRDQHGYGREAMRTVFNDYNVEYIDMSRHSGITLDMLPDESHPSSIEANRQYGRFLESYLF